MSPVFPGKINKWTLNNVHWFGLVCLVGWGFGLKKIYDRKEKEKKGSNPFLIIRSGGDGGRLYSVYFLCWGGLIIQ